MIAKKYAYRKPINEITDLQSMSRIVQTLLLFIVASTLYGQQAFQLGIQTDIGFTKGHFEQSKTILKSSGVAPTFYTPKIHASYRWKNLITLELGVSQSFFRWTLTDKDFENRHDGDYKAIIKNKAAFVSYFANIQVSPQINKNTFLYGALGYGSTYFGTDQVDASKTFVLNGEQLTITSEYTTNSSKYYQPEVGIQWRTKDQNLISFGLSYYMPINKTFLTANYQVLSGNQAEVPAGSTPSATNNIISTDKISTNANYFGINIRYNYQIHYIPKRERKPKEKKLDLIAEAADFVQEKYDTIPPVIDPNKETVNDREYRVTNKITVKSKTITVRVWDHQIVDGDRINLFLNGEWILENYTLEAKKKEIQITLPNETNDLILYALNLGKYKPNTAAIEIWDGHKNQFLILESNLNESGALEIKVKE